MSTTTPADKKDLQEIPEYAASSSTAQHEPIRLASWRFATILTAVLLSIFLVGLDESMTSSALPRVLSQFNGLAQVSWVGTAYFLAQAALFLPFGQCLTIAPAKYTYLTAVTLLVLGCLICALSRCIEVFIFGRAVSGAGAAGILLSALCVVGEIAPLKRRPLFLSMFSATFGSSAIIGLPIGGAFTDHTSWRWCFYINLPLGAVILAALYFLLDSHTPPAPSIYSGKTALGKLMSLDWIGMILIIGLSAALLLPLQWGGNVKPWDNAAVIACFCLSGVLAGVFVGWEYIRGEYALLVPRTIKRLTFICAALEAFFIFASQVVGVYYVPIWYQAAKGFSATRAGFCTIPLLASIMLGALTAGSVINKTGRYWPWLCTPLISSIGFGLLFTISPDTHISKVMGYCILSGFGLGAPFQNLFVAVQAELRNEPSMIPQVNSFVSFTQLLGPIVSVAAAGTIFGNMLPQNLARYAPTLSEDMVTQLRQRVSAVAEVDIEIRDQVRFAYSRSLTPSFIISIGGCILAAVCGFFIKNYNLKQISTPNEDEES